MHHYDASLYRRLYRLYLYIDYIDVTSKSAIYKLWHYQAINQEMIQISIC